GGRNRRDHTRGTIAGRAGISLPKSEKAMKSSPADRMPVVFFGHGNPMNAVQTNPWTEAWTALGAALPRPRAIVSVSAHWYLPGTSVTAMAAPKTIHDFGGFPRELYRVEYPAPGDPALAGRLQSLLAPVPVS